MEIMVSKKVSKQVSKVALKDNMIIMHTLKQQKERGKSIKVFKSHSLEAVYLDHFYASVMHLY